MFHVEQILANEIVLLLLRGPLHLRGIADSLNENHMTVGRKLALLVEDNAVDFSVQGKNKVYSLKKSVEARNYAIMAELYKQSKAIETYPVLRGIIHSVLEIPEVRLVLFFGSYAKGTVHDKSDIDLFIETRDSHIKKDLEKRHSMLSVKTGIFDMENPLIREIIKDHIIVRGMEDYYEKTRIFD